MMQQQPRVSGPDKLQMLEQLIRTHTDLGVVEKAASIAFAADSVTDDLADDLFSKRTLCAAELITAKAKLSDEDYATLLRLAGVHPETASFLIDLHAPKGL